MYNYLISIFGIDNIYYVLCFCSGFFTAVVIGKGRAIFWTVRRLKNQIKYLFRF